MDKNLILAIALSMAVYFGWYKMMERYYPQPAKPAASAAAAPAKTDGLRPPASGELRGEPTPPKETSLGPAAPMDAPRAGGLDGSLAFRVDTLEMRFQPLGASIVSYRYPGPLGAVELVDTPYPGFFATWPELRFRQIDEAGNWPTFEAAHPSGILIRKEFLLREAGNLNTLRLTFKNPGSQEAMLPPWNLDVGPGIGTVPSERKENPTLWSAAALLPAPVGKKVDVFKDLKASQEPGRSTDAWRWLGVHNRYFLAAMFPPTERFEGYAHGGKAVTLDVPSWTGGTKKEEVLQPWISASAKPLTLPAGGSVTVEIPFYFGPKGYIRLSEIGHGLERSVSFGWFHRVGRFTIQVLHKFHGWTGNWGWAIIMLTICLQVILFPVTYKQMKSMAIMKKIQPEIVKIQQKYQKDPKRLQVEMMEVYKKHGANPLSGCLPILVQMPIFIALFNMLRGAWELHGAPWIFWVQDLSAHDRFYILPIIMGAVMFFQSKMNPVQSADPMQAKMMTYMPVIFTVMFLNFPAGLVLYWLTNSVLSLIQQTAVRKHLEK